MIAKDFSKIYFILLTMCAVVSHGWIIGGRKSKKFNVLILSQHLPDTVCYLWLEKLRKNSCTLPDTNKWLIHGLWPTKKKKNGPHFCNKRLAYDRKSIKGLEDQLEDEWMSVHAGDDHHDFWKHQWDKHGTCAAALKPFNSVRKYFEKSLELARKYNMGNILDEAEIFPGHEYKVRDILDAVHNVLGKRVQVQCTFNRDTKEVYLHEVRICLNKKLRLVHCDGTRGSPTNCPRKKWIIYPASVPE